jgi:hypothetical protein
MEADSRRRKSPSTPLMKESEPGLSVWLEITLKNRVYIPLRKL